MREELVEKFGNDLAEKNSAGLVTANILEKRWSATNQDELVGDGESLKPILLKIFNMLDLNGDRTISESEGVAAGRALYGNAHKGQNWWDEMVAYADDDYDGKVHENEWLEFQIRDKGDMPLKLAQQELQAMMDKLEENQSRKVLQSPRGGARS